MFSALNYTKLKTNLRLAINRLKLIGKKKTELTQKSRKEIADYIAGGKEDRARIKVEQIIREDYLVEAFEILEMYCDLLLARFGLIEQMKIIDKGLEEAINSLLWAAPRLQTEISELKVISDQITYKYGKPYAEACRENKFEKVNEKLLHKLSVLTPPKVLVEQYMVEIAKSHNVPFNPDPTVLMSDEAANAEALLIDYQQQNRNDTSGFPRSGGGGGIGVAFDSRLQPDKSTSSFGSAFMSVNGSGQPQQAPFNYPTLANAGGSSANEKSDPHSFLNAPSAPPHPVTPPPPPYATLPPPSTGSATFDAMANLPDPPSDSLLDIVHPSGQQQQPGGSGSAGGQSRSGGGANHQQSPPGDEFDFDELNRRFEALKKKR